MKTLLVFICCMALAVVNVAINFEMVVFVVQALLLLWLIQIRQDESHEDIYGEKVSTFFKQRRVAGIN